MTIEITLSDEMRAFVENQIESGRFENTQEYFERLTLEDRAREEQAIRERKKAELEAMLTKSLEGQSRPIDESFWEEVVNRVDSRLAKRGLPGLRDALAQEEQEKKEKADEALSP